MRNKLTLLALSVVGLSSCGGMASRGNDNYINDVIGDSYIMKSRLEDRKVKDVGNEKGYANLIWDERILEPVPCKAITHIHHWRGHRIAELFLWGGQYGSDYMPRFPRSGWSWNNPQIQVHDVSLKKAKKIADHCEVEFVER